MKKNYVSIVLITSIVAFSVSCGSQGIEAKRKEKEKLENDLRELQSRIKKLEGELADAGDTGEKSKERMVSVTELSPSQFVHFVEIIGMLDAREEVVLSAKTPGTVKKIFVKPGDQVSSGQILAELDNEVVLQGIEELKSSLAFATDIYKKQKNLWEKKIGTELQYLTAKNNKDALEKKLATLGEQSDLSKIKSPIGGTVDAVDIKIGQSVAPGMPSIRVVNLSSLNVKAEVPEAYAPFVKKGNTAIIYFPDFKKEISTTVSHAAKTINRLSRTFSIEAGLPADNSDLSPNTSAVVKIADYVRDSAIVVPINVLQSSEEGQYLYIAVKGEKSFLAKKVLVKIGKTYMGNAEIKEGLMPKDRLITAGYQELSDGEAIKFQ